MNDKDIKIFNNLLEYIDPQVSNILLKFSDNAKSSVEEIRLRVGKPLMICKNGCDYYVSIDGKLVERNYDAFIVKRENIYKTFQFISNYSVYAFEEEIKNGFITLKGGHRVGIAGTIVYGINGIETIKNISSLNIRIARQKIGVSNKLMKYLIKNSNTIYHTLIISPPQCGKTTLLRDIVRNISDGISNYGFKGLKVGVVDERSEIGGVYNGKPQNDVGNRTDILDSCQKSDGIKILIRAMSPQVIATDELGGYKDVESIHEALKVGVKVITTVHGENIDDLLSKKALKQLIDEKIFERIIFLDNSKGVGTIKDIVDGSTFKSIFY